MSASADPMLAALGALVPLAPDAAARIDALATRRVLAAGEHLLRDGDVCGHVAFVERGLVRVYFVRDGDGRTAFFAPEGQFVSDYGSVLTGEPSTMNIEAIEATAVRMLSRRAIEAIYRQVDIGERLGRRIAEALFVATQRRFASFYLDSAEERYRQLLADEPALAQRVPQHLLASYVGVRPGSLSRIRARIARTPRDGQAAARRGSSPG